MSKIVDIVTLKPICWQSKVIIVFLFISGVLEVLKNVL